MTESNSFLAAHEQRLQKLEADVAKLQERLPPTEIEGFDEPEPLPPPVEAEGETFPNAFEVSRDLAGRPREYIQRAIAKLEEAIRTDERRKLFRVSPGMVRMADDLEQLRAKLEAAERTVENYADRVEATEQLRDEAVTERDAAERERDEAMKVVEEVRLFMANYESIPRLKSLSASLQAFDRAKGEK